MWSLRASLGERDSYVNRKVPQVEGGYGHHLDSHGCQHWSRRRRGAVKDRSDGPVHRCPRMIVSMFRHERLQPMDGVTAIAHVLRQEGVEFIGCMPSNPLIEAAAIAGIRPIVCRQERTGVHMADGFSRVTNGRRIGVFLMQAGPGAENAFGGVAQAFADSVPILLLPAGANRDRLGVPPTFSPTRSYEAITKWSAQINLADRVSELMRRAFTKLRSGRPGPVLLE